MTLEERETMDILIANNNDLKKNVETYKNIAEYWNMQYVKEMEKNKFWGNIIKEKLGIKKEIVTDDEFNGIQ